VGRAVASSVMIKMTASSACRSPHFGLSSLRSVLRSKTIRRNVKITATLMSVPARYDDFWTMLL